MAQVIGNFFGGIYSVGVDLYDHLDTDNWDNGVYVIEDWEIVDRLFMSGGEQQEYPLREMVEQINSCFVKEDQLPEEVINDYFSLKVVSSKNM